MGGEFEWIVGDQHDLGENSPLKKLERLNTLVEESPTSSQNMSRPDINILVTKPPDASPQRLSPNASFAYRPDSRRHTGNSILSNGADDPESLSRRPSIFGNLRRGSFSVHKKNLIEFLQRHGSKLSLNKSKDDSKPPELPIVTEMRNKNRAVAEDHFSTALSALYAKLLIVLGIAFPVTDVISDESPANFYQGFYLYLYLISVVFVCFLFVVRIRHQAKLSYLVEQYQGQPGIPDTLKPDPVRFGSFYLRVGAVAFGIGSMVYSGLEFGQYFELKRDEKCQNVLIALIPAARMVLCIVQMQFIFFSDGQFHMDQHRYVARFGLMHMVATNLCEWLYVIIEEAKHEIVHIAAHGGEVHGHVVGGSTIAVALNGPNLENHSHHHQLTRRSADIHHIGGAFECHRSNIMGSLVQNAAPFLFPCTIEYSLICAVILYEMWKKLNKSGGFGGGAGHHGGTGHRKGSRKSLTGKSANRLSIDFSRAQRGMFSGILVTVLTIIVLIMYFVLYKEPSYRRMATFEVTISEILMYSLTGAAVVWAMARMRDLKFAQKKSGIALDCTLLLLAQVGVYIYSMFSIIGTFFSIGVYEFASVYSVAAEMLSLAQTSLQTLFIMNAWWRRCKGARQNRKKPGREIITFLLIANMSIWFINTLVKTNASFRPTLLEFYGPWAWTIITHVSMPLAIFYRFHSTICLFEVWKNCYKVRYDQ